MTAHLLVHAIQAAQTLHDTGIVHAVQTAHGLIAAPAPHPTSLAKGSSSVFSGSSGAAGGSVAKPPYDEFLKQLLQFLIFIANLVGGIIIGIAIIREALVYVVQLVLHGGRSIPDKEAIRLSLGRSLALALEFQLGADILGTALDPSAQDLIVLGAIILLRTFLNVSLGREIDEEARRIKETHEGEGSSPTGRGSGMAAIRRKLDESTS